MSYEVTMRVERADFVHIFEKVANEQPLTAVERVIIASLSQDISAGQVVITMCKNALAALDPNDFDQYASKIELIKQVRARTGTTLKEAKLWVEQNFEWGESKC